VHLSSIYDIVTNTWSKAMRLYTQYCTHDQFLPDYATVVENSPEARHLKIDKFIIYLTMSKWTLTNFQHKSPNTENCCSL